MEITLERVNSDYLFEATNTQGHRVFLDNKSKKSGVVRGVSPMEVLLMGLAGCSSIDIIDILNKQKINPTSLKMKVLGNRNKDKVPSTFDSIDIEIFLDGENITKEKAKRAAELSYQKYCSVSKMIDSVANINFNIVLNGKRI
tara:strand:+ start:4192 stop:4620 length:429 start_codon:yes stop_codon:yes gene_type:complete